MCTFGMRTGLIMKILVENILKEEGTDAEVAVTNATDIGGLVASSKVDMIVSHSELEGQLCRYGVPLALLDNLVDKEEARKRIRRALEQLKKAQ